VGVAHVFKFHNALCLFCNHLAYNVLLCGGEEVGEEGNKFHHEIGFAPKGLAMQRIVKEGDGNALMLLGNLDMGSPHNLVLGMCKKGGIGGTCSRRRNGLGVFGTIPDVLELEAKSNGGPLGLS